MDVKIAIQKLGSKSLFVKVSGEVNLVTAYSLAEPMTKLVRRGYHHLVVDLEDVKFMDSSGLGILISLQRLLEESHGEMSVICSNPNLLKLFSITNFAQLVKVFERKEEALESVNTTREMVGV